MAWVWVWGLINPVVVGRTSSEVEAFEVGLPVYKDGRGAMPGWGWRG